MNDEKTFLIPLAFDLEKGQVRNPIDQYQAKQFTHDDIEHVIQSINKALGNPLSIERLRVAFEKHWEDLESRIEAFRASQPISTDKPAKRDLQEMVEELIVSTREHQTALNTIAEREVRPRAMNAQYIVVESALAKLGQMWGATGPISIKRLADARNALDAEDWDIIETAPFLVWYLATYFSTTRPGEGDLGDVPF